MDIEHLHSFQEDPSIENMLALFTSDAIAHALQNRELPDYGTDGDDAVWLVSGSRPAPRP